MPDRDAATIAEHRQGRILDGEEACAISTGSRIFHPQKRAAFQQPKQLCYQVCRYPVSYGGDVCPIAQDVLDRLAGRHRYGFGFFLRTDLDIPHTGQGDAAAFICAVDRDLIQWKHLSVWIHL